jgi:DNA polymerase IV
LIAIMALALPPTYLLQTHLSLEALHELEDQIPTLTYDITEAKLVIGKVTTKQRALFELRSRKLWTEEILPQGTKIEEGGAGRIGDIKGPPPKRRKIEDTKGKNVISLDSETESDVETNGARAASHQSQQSTQSLGPAPDMSSPLLPGSPSSTASSIDRAPDIEWDDTIKVVKLAWFMESLAAGHLLPFGNYLVYEGRPIQKPETKSPEPHIKVKVRGLNEAKKSLRVFGRYLGYLSPRHRYIQNAKHYIDS